MNDALRLFDTHVHLDEEQFAADVEAVVARAKAAGVQEMLCVATTARSSHTVVELAHRVVELARDDAVVALGETGLDRHWDFAPFETQQDYFDRHLRLAQEIDLPVVIHCREAEAELLPMLRKARARGPLRGVLHAFGSSLQTARECLEMGLFVSFAGNVTWRNRKFEPLRAVAREVPADRLLLERRRNEPAWLVHTLERLAAVREVSPAQLAVQSAANARRLFCGG